MRSASILIALAATAAAPAIASAQLITPIGQDRTVSASSVVSHASGATYVDEPPPWSVAPGDYTAWLQEATTSGFLAVDESSGNTTGNARLDGGWNGDDAIVVYSMSINASGSGGPNYSGTINADMIFSYTFTIDQPLNYTLVGGFGGCPFGGTVRFSNAVDDIHSYEFVGCGPNAEFDEAGLLQPGEYTLELIAGGSVSFSNPADAGGGWGGGAGGIGLTPLEFRVTVPSCSADLTGDSMVDVFDLLAFLDFWFVADGRADIDGTPGVDVFDLLQYLDGWFAGC